MGFVPRFNRREEGGGYTAFYGKGQHQLTAVLEKCADGLWHVTEGFQAGAVTPAKKISDVKAGWGGLAEAGYKQTPGEGAAPAAEELPAPPSRSSPPVLRKGGGPPSLCPPPPVKSKPVPEVSNGLGDDTFGEGSSDRFPTPEMAAPGVATCPDCHMPFHGWTWQEHEPHKRAVPPCRCNFPNGEDYEPDPFDYRMYSRDEHGKLTLLTPIGALDKVFAWIRRNSEYVMTDGKLDPLWESVREVLFRTTGYAEYRNKE